MDPAEFYEECDGEMSYREDPIIRAIYKELKEPINLLIKQKYYRASIILIFSAMDALANLARPNDADMNTPQDFKLWVSRYLRISGTDAKITPEDWWSARNAYIHTHSPFSRDTESNKAGYVIFAWGNVPVWHNPKNPEMVVVNIPTFRDAFFQGIDNFVIEAFASANEERRKVLEERLNKMSVSMSKEEMERKYNRTG